MIKICSSIFFVMMLIYSSVWAETVYQDSLLFQVIQYQFVLDRSTVKKATLINQKNGNFVGLQIELNPEVVADFDKIGTEGKGKKMNIVINNHIISTANIQTSLGSNFLISTLTKEEAKKFVDKLNAGN